MNEKTRRIAHARQRDTSQKRQSIIAAAMEEFRDKGYDGSSMDRIAEIAGASKRTVYNHFPSKDELFRAVIDRFGDQLRSLKLIRYDPARSVEEQLSEFADAELAVVEDPAWMGFIKVLLSVFMRDPALARESVSRHMAGEDPMTAWMREAAQDGRLAIDNPALAARIFSAMLSGAFTWPAVYQGYLDTQALPAIKRELIETFLGRYRLPAARPLAKRRRQPGSKP
jgi:TetR/AcrR family transcriptional regulator of autoinduction and epiphytic fitness